MAHLNRQSSTICPTALGGWVLLLGLASVAALGCDSNKAEPKAEPAKAAASATQTGAAAAPAPAPSETEVLHPAESFDEDKFALKISPTGPYKAGEPAEVEVVLTAKDGFKCNDEYPYKFKTTPTEGVTYPKPVLKKDAVKLGKSESTLRVPFVAESAGEQTVQGTFHFSVCSDEKCLVEKRPLKLTVPVL